MASPEVRQMHARCSQMIQSAGAEIVRKEKTGSGHTKVIFRYDGREQFFVMPSTPSCHRAGKNLEADLRRKLVSMTGSDPKNPRAPTVPPKTAKASPEAPPQQERKTSNRLSPERRKEIAKAYLSAPSVYSLSVKTGVPEQTIKNIVRAQSGQGRNKLNAEENELRALAAKRARINKGKNHPALSHPQERAKLARHAFRMYFHEGRPAQDIAEIIGVSKDTVLKLVQEVKD